MLKLIFVVFMTLFIQGDLPYWSQKSGREPTAVCNQYRLYRYNTDISISTAFSYRDCFGIERTVYIGPDYGYQTYICSSTTPVLEQIPGTPVPPQAFAELEGSCGDDEDPEKPDDPDAPEIGCDTEFSYGGGRSYPSKYLIDLGTITGTVTVEYQAFGVPDKFLIIDPNRAAPLSPVVAHSGGYRGNVSFQGELCDFYASRGFGCPNCMGPLTPPSLMCEITGGGEGSFTFTKTSSMRWVYLEVYAPLHGTAWDVTVGCPVVL